ncbi:MAG: DUF3826 domain-containing protein [Niabella sp.]
MIAGMPDVSKKYLYIVLIIIMSVFVACNSAKNSSKGLTEEEQAYRTAIDNRSAKIVATLNIPDSAKFYKVRDVIAKQYRDLKDLQEGRDSQIQQINEKYAGNKGEADVQVKNAKRASEVKVNKLHKDYLKRLDKYLSAEQIDKIKDGMTYGVFPLTYKAHLDMIPTLKPEEKKYIWDALYEAREIAMDGGSSDEKHAIFGKYKGRINNYLAARGYNLTQEREAWYKRIDAAKKN